MGLRHAVAAGQSFFLWLCGLFVVWFAGLVDPTAEALDAAVVAWQPLTSAVAAQEVMASVATTQVPGMAPAMAAAAIAMKWAVMGDQRLVDKVEAILGTDRPVERGTPWHLRPRLIPGTDTEAGEHVILDELYAHGVLRACRHRVATVVAEAGGQALSAATCGHSMYTNLVYLDAPPREAYLATAALGHPVHPPAPRLVFGQLPHPPDRLSWSMDGSVLTWGVAALHALPSQTGGGVQGGRRTRRNRRPSYRGSQAAPAPPGSP